MRPAFPSRKIAAWRTAARSARALGDHPFIRAILLLTPERGKALLLVSAGALTAVLQVLEPLLFGKAISALAQHRSPLAFVGLWCLLSLSGFAASVGISLLADGMAHRRRLGTMAAFVEHLLALPPAFHHQARAGRLMRIMISGCETLFFFWLPLLPVAMWTNWRLAIVLFVLMITYSGSTSS